MHTSAVTSGFATPRAPRTTSRRTHRVVPLVIIDVTVPGTSSAEGRRALHASLGDDLRLYVVTVDQQNQRVTFRVEVTSRTLDDVIGLLTTTLDRATLGRAQDTVIRQPRDC
ncbi:hypothetical protein LFL96_23035 [Paraburkholderia sp. D15]|uniref:hypothetical protein n=1 Tax=Paraburkholderia sp. D15 TaxID=2880218 RepID=UPI00247AC436|nr:hypothetical protein [Paraburkholderia sp. D15]WGS53916.1 hypothetical protein LFL96_23035 [Paraburkholderia sp. D15]